MQAYGGALSIFAFGIMWASIVGSATLGYIFIKKKEALIMVSATPITHVQGGSI